VFLDAKSLVGTQCLQDGDSPLGAEVFFVQRLAQGRYGFEALGRDPYGDLISVERFARLLVIPS
jgi:hypothetical protein